MTSHKKADSAPTKHLMTKTTGTKKLPDLKMTKTMGKRPLPKKKER